MPTVPLARRATLAAAALGGLVACSGGRDGRRGDGRGDGRVDEPGDDPGGGPASSPSPHDRRRLAYGDHPSQWADLSLPAGTPRGVVVVVHGGFWRAAYGAELGEPLAADLVARGWATLNVEYRRVGGGGGFPATLDDVAAAIDLLRGQRAVPGPVVTLGHSAGGHLATWAAARTRFGRWSPGVEVTHVVSQAGVLDLTTAALEGLGSGAVVDLLGGIPDSAPDAYDLADPTRHLPLDQPVWAVHARDDDSVPFTQSADYVAAARAVGGRAELVEVTGGHFAVIDPASSAWRRVVAVLEEIASS